MESPRICEVSWGLIRVWRFCHVLMSPNLWRRWRTKWSGWVHRQLEIWESSFVTSCTCWNSPVASAATCCHSQVVDGTWTVAWNLSSLSNWVACHHLFPSSCLGWWFHAAYLPMLHALSRSLKPPRLCCKLYDFLLSLSFMSLSEAQCQKDTSAKCQAGASNHGLR